MFMIKLLFKRKEKEFYTKELIEKEIEEISYWCLNIMFVKKRFYQIN